MINILGELTLTQSINREEVSALEVVIYASDGLQTTEWSRRIEVQKLTEWWKIYSPKYDL